MLLLGVQSEAGLEQRYHPTAAAPPSSSNLLLLHPPCLILYLSLSICLYCYLSSSGELLLYSDQKCDTRAYSGVVSVRKSGIVISSSSETSKHCLVIVTFQSHRNCFPRENLLLNLLNESRIHQILLDINSVSNFLYYSSICVSHFISMGIIICP